MCSAFRSEHRIETEPRHYVGLTRLQAEWSTSAHAVQRRVSTNPMSITAPDPFSPAGIDVRDQLVRSLGVKVEEIHGKLK